MYLVAIARLRDGDGGPFAPGARLEYRRVGERHASVSRSRGCSSISRTMGCRSPTRGAASPPTCGGTGWESPPVDRLASRTKRPTTWPAPEHATPDVSPTGLDAFSATTVNPSRADPRPDRTIPSSPAAWRRWPPPVRRGDGRRRPDGSARLSPSAACEGLRRAGDGAGDDALLVEGTARTGFPRRPTDRSVRTPSTPTAAGRTRRRPPAPGVCPGAGASPSGVPRRYAVISQARPAPNAASAARACASSAKVERQHSEPGQAREDIGDGASVRRCVVAGSASDPDDDRHDGGDKADDRRGKSPVFAVAYHSPMNSTEDPDSSQTPPVHPRQREGEHHVQPGDELHEARGRNAGAHGAGPPHFFTRPKR